MTFSLKRQPRPKDLRAAQLQSAQDLRAQVGRPTVETATFGPSPAVRLLPIVIVAAVFMLGFRVQIVIQDIAHTRTATVKVEQATAVAAQAPAAPAAQT